MTFTELQNNPAIRADFASVARPLDEYLVSHLLTTCAGSEGNAEHAQAEIGAARAIANIIQTLRSLTGAPVEKKPISIGQKLNRFTPDQNKSES